MSITQQKRDALSQYIRNNSGAFTVLNKEGTSLLQATSMYVSLRGINKITPVNLSSKGLIRSAVWSAFIVQNGLNLSLPEDTFRYLSGIAILDDFESNYNNFNGMVITSKCRVKDIGPEKAIVPKVLFSKWCGRVVSSLMEKIDDEHSNHLSFGDKIIDGGIWPEDDFDCHSDERYYPTLNKKVTGYEKWSYDKYLLENNIDLPEGYKLGVYQMENEV